MLGKLFRYDMKNIGRQMALGYLVLGVLAVMHLIIKQIRMGIASNVIIDAIYLGISGIFCVGLAAIIGMVIGVSVRYIYKNLFRDEGYLMHTIPTTPGRLMASKLLVSILWLGITLLACYLCVVVASADLFWTGGLLDKLYATLPSGMDKGRFLANLAIMLIMFYINILCGIFMAMSICFSTHMKSRGICIVGMGILFYQINQIIIVITELLGMLAEHGSLADLNAVMSEQMPGAVLGRMILECAAVYGVLAVVYSAVAVNRMKERLNLD